MPAKTPSFQENFQTHKADWEMSTDSKFERRRTGLAPQGGSADFHYRHEERYYRDIEKSRDLDRNEAIAGHSIDQVVSNTIQDGFSLDVKTGDSKLDADLKAMWNEWSTKAENCDLAGELCFQEMEEKVFRACLVDGDIFSLSTDTGMVQLIEGHSIATHRQLPGTVLGVELDGNRRRKRFHVMRDSINPNDTRKQAAEAFDVRDDRDLKVFNQIYDPKRITQTRGVTCFAPIHSWVGMFGDINFARMVQQQVVSSFAFLRQKKFYPDGSTGPVSKGKSGKVTTPVDPVTKQPIPQTDLQVDRISQIGPGMDVIAPENEEIQGFSPRVPNPEFFMHMRLVLQIIGKALGLPLCIMLMDPSEGNFSAWRGAIDEAKKGFRHNQKFLKRRFHRPTYIWKVTQWMEMDRAMRLAARRSNIDIFGHSWNAPGWKYIEPKTDAEADAFRVRNGLTSPRRLHNELGQDHVDIVTETVEDNAVAVILAKRQAIEINQSIDDGQPVHWRELVNMAMPDGLKMDMLDPKEAEAKAGGSNGDEERKLSAAEAIQKIYLGIGTVITPDEGREILRTEYGIDLPPGVIPDQEPDTDEDEDGE